jgi:ribosome maturation factor RimP
VSNRLNDLLEPVVADLGYELVLLEFNPYKGGATLRLYIDIAASARVDVAENDSDAEAGIKLEDCERVSREVAALLDVEDAIQQAYRLEVSSPGLDRPLVKPAHFQRFAGEEAKVQMLVPQNGRKRFQGVIAGCDVESVVLEAPEGRYVLPLADIERARLVPNFAPTLNPGKTG